MGGQYCFRQCVLLNLGCMHAFAAAALAAARTAAFAAATLTAAPLSG